MSLTLVTQSSQTLLPLCLSIASRRNSQLRPLSLSMSSTHKTKRSPQKVCGELSEGWGKQRVARRRRCQRCARWTRQTRVETEQQRSPLLPNLLLTRLLLPFCSIQTVCCGSVVPSTSGPPGAIRTEPRALRRSFISALQLQGDILI